MVTENYPEGFIVYRPTESITQGVSSSSPGSLDSAISSFKSSLIAQGFIDKGNNVFESKDGLKRITIRADGSYSEETFKETTSSVSEDSAQLKAIQKQYASLNKQINDAERRGQPVSDYVYSRLSQLKQMERDLINTGSAYTTQFIQRLEKQGESTSSVPVESTSERLGLVKSSSELLNLVPYNKEFYYAPITEQGLGNKVFVQREGDTSYSPVPIPGVKTSSYELTSEAVKFISAPSVDYGVSRQVNTSSLISQGVVKPTSEVFGVTPLYSISKTAEDLGGGTAYVLGVALAPTVMFSEVAFNIAKPIIQESGRVVGDVAGLGIGVSASPEVTSGEVKFFERPSQEPIGSYYNVALIGAGIGTSMFASASRSAITVGGLLVSVPQAIAKPSFESFSNVALFSLGVPEVLPNVGAVLSRGGFSSEAVLRGTISEVPSSVGVSVRAQEFLKRRGISSSTVDTIDSLPYVGIGEKVTYRKEPISILDKASGVESSSFVDVPVRSELVFFDKTSVTPVFASSREGAPIVRYIVEKFPKVVEGVNADGLPSSRTQYILASKGEVSARITSDGLIPASTGSIPLIEVSRYPYQEAKINLFSTPSEFRLTPVEYSAYLMEKYPNYKGIGFDASSGGGNTIFYKSGKVEVNVDFNIPETGKVVKVDIDTVLYYKANQGEVLNSILGKRYIDSRETVLAHELVHAERRAAGDNSPNELDAFGVMINAFESGKNPEFLVSVPERVYSKSSFVDFPSQIKSFEEGLVQSAGRPTIALSVGQTTLATRFGFSPDTSVQRVLSEPVALLEYKPSRSMKPIGSSSTSEVSRVSSPIEVVSSESSTIVIELSAPLESLKKSSLEAREELALSSKSSPKELPPSQVKISSYASDSISVSDSFSSVKSVSRSVPIVLYESSSILSSSYELKERPQYILSSSYELKSDSSYRSDVIPKSDLEPKIDSVLIPQLKSSLEQKQILETKQILEPKQGLEPLQSIVPLKTVVETPRPPEEPRPRMLIGKSESARKSRKKLEVRRRGKFSVVDVGDSIANLDVRGQRILRETLAASYRIVSDLGKVESLPIPRGFVASKRERGVIVQPRGSRLGSSGERIEIRQAKRFKL